MDLSMFTQASDTVSGIIDQYNDVDTAVPPQKRMRFRSKGLSFI